MKRLVLVILSIIFLSGCAKTQFENTIDEYLTRQAQNTDIGYESQHLTMLDTVSVEESIENWYAANKDGALSKDSIKMRMQKSVASRSNYSDTAKQLQYAKLKHRYERIKELESRKLKSIDFYFVENAFVIKNPVDNSWRTQTRYYLIDEKRNVLAEISESEYNMMKAQYDAPALYEQALFNAKYRKTHTLYP